jgi:type VI secretion system VasD/TssJ family lipoprotein
MHYIKFVFLLLTLLLIGCSSTPKPSGASDNKFAEDAILIKYGSNKNLNMYDNQSHDIPLVVYQLDDINSFNTLKKNKTGIIKLLQNKKFDKHVMSVSKFFISPNETKQIFLNRANDVSWVCLVAGYYDLKPSQSTLQYKISDYNKWKFYESEKKQKFMTINIYFDKSSMEQRQE